MHLSGVEVVEWFTLLMLIVTVGFPVVFLLIGFLRHHMDDPDCSKYEVFYTDTSMASSEQPNIPIVCEPRYLQKRSWFSSVNTAWVWVTLVIAFLWFFLMLGIFLFSLYHQSMRESMPV